MIQTSFSPITFKHHMQVVDGERRNPIDFWVTGSKVKVNFDTLPMKPCGQDTDYSFCTATFKLYTCQLLMMRGGTLMILGCGVKGQGQLWHSVY